MQRGVMQRNLMQCDSYNAHRRKPRGPQNRGAYELGRAFRGGHFQAPIRVHAVPGTRCTRGLHTLQVSFIGKRQTFGCTTR
eukprot:772396-Pelagomonas_calceolata.AAC.6